VGLIYLDTCLVIYAFENDPVFGARTRAALAASPTQQFAVSPLVKFECLVGPMRSANLVLQQHYEDGLGQFVLLPATEDVFLRGAALRARFGLKTPDALHLAAAQIHGCDELWTNDDRLAAAAGRLARNVFA